MNALTKLLATLVITASSASSLYANSLSQAQASAGFLQANSKAPGVVTLASGLEYKILEVGTGPKPRSDSTVVVDYEGSLVNGQVFDSSYARGEPASFQVNQVIQGWQQGLLMMPVGSTWMLYIPANLAYGPEGAGDAVPPDAALIFKVHLISTN